MALVEYDLPFLWFAQGRKDRYPFYRRDEQRIPLISPDGRRLKNDDIGIPEAHGLIHASWGAKDADAPVTGTLLHGITKFRCSPEFQQLAPHSRYLYNTEFNWLLKVSNKGQGHGHRPMATMTQEVVVNLRKERFEIPEEFRDEKDRQPTPGAANSLLVALGSLCKFVKVQPKKFALPRGWRSPTREVTALKGGSGHRPWEEDEICDFRRKWNSICLERVLFEVLLATGQRSIDVRRMKVNAYRSGRIRFLQAKTRHYVWITVADLKAILDPWLKSHGRDEFFPSRSGGSISASHMSQVMRDAITAAGLPGDCTVHGLRYTVATQLIEVGADYQTIESVIGHSTMAMAIKYTKQWRRERLANVLRDRGLAAQRPQMLISTASPKDVALGENIDGTVEPTDSGQAGISASERPPSQAPLFTDISAPDLGIASASRQKRVAVQSGATGGDPTEPPDLADAAQMIADPPLPSPADAHPIIPSRGRIAGVVLVQINNGDYEVRKDPCVFGVASFVNRGTEYGWQFLPRLDGLHRSKKLHPNAEACLKGRFSIASVLSLSSL
jgi:hypothetical protein